MEKANRAYYICSEDMINRTKDMEKVVVANRNDIPIRDLGTVHFGAPKRLGAITIEGGGMRRANRDDVERRQCQCGNERTGEEGG